MDKMIVGLTGNICTGKSWVAKQFNQHSDVKVIDCDSVAKQLLRKYGFDHQVLNEVLFSRDETGAIIRQHLKDNFYPKLWENIKHQIDNDTEHSIFIVEGALIFELKWSHHFDEVFITCCDTVTQYKRISKKFPNEVDAMYDRLSFQMPQTQKLHYRGDEGNWICTDNDDANVIHIIRDIYASWSIS